MQTNWTGVRASYEVHISGATLEGSVEQKDSITWQQSAAMKGLDKVVPLKK